MESCTKTISQETITATSSDWTNLIWDSAKTPLETKINTGGRSEDITYDGNSLNFNGTTYYWRIRFWSTGDVEGDWSTENAYFTK